MGEGEGAVHRFLGWKKGLLSVMFKSLDGEM